MSKSKSEFVLELPKEMLEHIALFLDAHSLTFLSQTCKLFYSITDTDTLWRNLCQKDFAVSDNKGWNLTYKLIYTRILYPYPILGFKRLALRPFGGLIHVKWAESEIRVSRIFSSWSYSLELVMEPAFSLTWNHEAEDVDVKCVHNPDETAPAVLIKDGPHFVLQCKKKNCFRSHQRSSHSLGQSDSRVPEGFMDYPGTFKSFSFSKGYSCPILPMEFHPTPDHFPVTPGLYRGDYGGHGVEIIQVKVNESNPYLLEGLKISGDPNVPAGNISILAYLDKPICLSEDEQRNTDEMTEADKRRPEEEYQRLLEVDRESWRQPFVLPLDAFEGDANAPSKCTARYLGHGRIAGHNFNSPSLCDIHVAKFDDDTFGILWLGLSCFMMMQREKNILKEPHYGKNPHGTQ